MTDLPLDFTPIDIVADSDVEAYQKINDLAAQLQQLLAAARSEVFGSLSIRGSAPTFELWGRSDLNDVNRHQISTANNKLLWKFVNDGITASAVAFEMSRQGITPEAVAFGVAMTSTPGAGFQKRTTLTAGYADLMETSGMPASYTGRRQNGTFDAPTGIVSGDTITSLGAVGRDSSAMATSAAAGIFLVANETWSPTAHGVDINFSTTNTGSTNRLTRLILTTAGVVKPGSDNLQTFGNASARWSVIFAGTATINTSDERLKQDIEAIPDVWLDAWGEVEWSRYRWRDAVLAKGDDARWHLGLIAQRVKAAFDRHGVDGLAIGVLCYDAWDDHHIYDPNPEGDDKPAIPRLVAAGDRWGLRYEEAFALEAAWQRREMSRLRAQLES